MMKKVAALLVQRWQRCKREAHHGYLVCSLRHTHSLPDAHGCAAQETSYGVLRPPLGSVRLTVIELVAVLLRAGSEAAERAIMASSAVQEVLQVFLRFPFNSILHHQASSRALHSLSCC